MGERFWWVRHGLSLQVIITLLAMTISQQARSRGHSPASGSLPSCSQKQAAADPITISWTTAASPAFAICICKWSLSFLITLLCTWVEWLKSQPLQFLCVKKKKNSSQSHGWNIWPCAVTDPSLPGCFWYNLQLNWSNSTHMLQRAHSLDNNDGTSWRHVQFWCFLANCLSLWL